MNVRSPRRVVNGLVILGVISILVCLMRGELVIVGGYKDATWATRPQSQIAWWSLKNFLVNAWPGCLLLLLALVLLCALD